jgi:hypothetical protein
MDDSRKEPGLFSISIFYDDGNPSAEIYDVVSPRSLLYFGKLRGRTVNRENSTKELKELST